MGDFKAIAAVAPAGDSRFSFRSSFPSVGLPRFPRRFGCRCFRIQHCVAQCWYAGATNRVPSLFLSNFSTSTIANRRGTATFFIQVPVQHVLAHQPSAYGGPPTLAALAVPWRTPTRARTVALVSLLSGFVAGPSKRFTFIEPPRARQRPPCTCWTVGRIELPPHRPPPQDTRYHPHQLRMSTYISQSFRATHFRQELRRCPEQHALGSGPSRPS